MTAESDECDEMFNDVDDGEWNISDVDDDDPRGDIEKEQDKVKANIREMKHYQISFSLCFVDF